MRTIEIPTSCVFSDYFKLGYYPEEIFSYFGYGFTSYSVHLPQSSVDPTRILSLRQRLEESLPYISFDNELARREFLIAPVLMELVHHLPVKIKVSYPLSVSEQLRGSVDYFLESDRQLLVIEAKDENLEKGIKQLGVELIALDQSLGVSDAILYGAVSIGKIWQFALLDRSKKQIVQDLNLYRVPGDLEILLTMILGILSGGSEQLLSPTDP